MKKVALVCEQLTKRNPFVENFELLAEVYDTAKIYSLVHHVGNILGIIEQHPIYSTAMSRMVRKQGDFERLSFLVPSMVKSLKIDEDTDLVISFTQGLSHLIEVPKNAKHLVYVYDWNIPNKTLMNKMFNAFLTKSSLQALEKADKVLYSSMSLKNTVEKMQNKRRGFVLPPSFRTSDYPKPKADFEDGGFYVVYAPSVNEKMYAHLKKIAHNYQLKFIFVGEDEHLQKLPKDERLELWGERCSGEFAPLVFKARAFIDIGESAFPAMCMAALAMERPLIVMDNQINKEFINEENALFIHDKSEIEQAIISMSGKFEEFSRNRLRNNALHFSQGRYKYEFNQSVELLLS